MKATQNLVASTVQAEVRQDRFTSPEYELSWSWKLKLAIKPIMWLAILDSLIMTGIMWAITRVLPRSHPFRRDQRQWPSSLMFFWLGTGCRYIKRHSMQWQALEYLYSWTKRTLLLRGLDRILSDLWNELENCRATRNRLRLVRDVIRREVDTLIRHKSEDIRILSLAAGSARGPIEVVAHFLRAGALSLDKVFLLLVDDDEESFEFARGIAQQEFPGLENRIETKRMRISGKPEGIERIKELILTFRPSIIEMAGFTDYMSEGKAVLIFEAIHSSIPSGSLFITNNVQPNDEQRFLEIVVTWKMLNRTEHKMKTVFERAGFSDAMIIWEPTRIQPLYIARAS